MPTVVIPAHNEAQGIERCLASVLADGVVDLTVVVVANACADDTAARARRFGPQVLVVDTPDGGKTNALNLGEAALRDAGRDNFPRLFLDGDIELEPGTLRALFAAVADGQAQVVSAEPVFVVSQSSWMVRLFFAAERFNPYHHTTAPNGSGTYCVPAAGRQRWERFPAVIADDGYVGSRFAAAERRTVPGARARVQAPRTFRAMRRIEARQRAGTAELQRQEAPREGRNPGLTMRCVAAATLPNPLRWPAFAVWVLTRVLERFEARSLAKRRGAEQWQQDRTSRQA